MKRILLLFGVCFLSITSIKAQFTISDAAGNQVADGAVITTNSTARRSASWDFLVVNNTSSDIYVKAELVSTTGDPSQFEFCFGFCYTGISLNQELPVQDPVMISANGDSGRGNHMYNMGSNGSAIWDFEMQFFQTDITGTNRLGNVYTITYRYDVNATASVDDHEELAFQVKNTVVKDGVLRVNSEDNYNLELYSLLGKRVFKSKIDSGSHLLNVDHLSAQVYILRVTHANGTVKNFKVILR